MRGRARRQLPLRAALLAATALLGSAVPGAALDATWEFAPTVLGPTPGSFDFNAGANWNPSSVPDGTATFAATAGPSISFSSAATTVGAFTFTGPTAYSFTLG
jgi:hypothetical protein